MRLMERLEQMMGMTDEVWQRHANPWSGWSRMTVLPLMALAIWSRVWIGTFAWAAVALVMLWTWWNPRAFAPPQRFDNWMTRGVLGERVYLVHRSDLPHHHLRAAKLLGGAAVPGLIVMGYGLWVLNASVVVFGVILAMMPKLWFLDRMVWILEDWQRGGRDVPGLPQGARDV